MLKTNLTFTVSCSKCGQPIKIEFDIKGDVMGNVISSGWVDSALFDSPCTPLIGGGFMHGFCPW